MSCIKINGIEVSKYVKKQVKTKIDQLRSNGIEPCLATILVGSDIASTTYIKNKHIACKEVGICTVDHRLPPTFSQQEMDKLIDSLNSDRNIHGILVQLPLPSKLNMFRTISRIDPHKDVDGLTPYNLGLLTFGKKMLVACTPSGIMEMFRYYKIVLSGKNVIVINRSNLIGKPLHSLLIKQDATVISCHSMTINLKKLCKLGDIIITAVGNRSKFILTEDMIKRNAVVIDAAISKYNDRLIGDTDFEKIINKASYATPVPGGVGPVTVAMLLKNTSIAASLVNN